MDWDMDFTEDEAVPVPRDELVHRMDNMMSMILDLTQKWNSYDNQQTERVVSPVGSPSMSQDARRKASPTCQLDMSETMRRRVEQRQHQLHLQDERSSELQNP